jgi:hypothetical protein
MVNFKVTIEGVSGLIQSNARIVGLSQPKTEAEFRAMTPPAFAKAFYEANK